MSQVHLPVPLGYRTPQHSELDGCFSTHTPSIITRLLACCAASRCTVLGSTPNIALSLVSSVCSRAPWTMSPTDTVAPGLMMECRTSARWIRFLPLNLRAPSPPLPAAASVAMQGVSTLSLCSLYLRSHAESSWCRIPAAGSSTGTSRANLNGCSSLARRDASGWIVDSRLACAHACMHVQHRVRESSLPRRNGLRRYAVRAERARPPPISHQA